jgi:hypothetical protein
MENRAMTRDNLRIRTTNTFPRKRKPSKRELKNVIRKFTMRIKAKNP